MKRQLSLVLALVMILGSFSSVFAALPETVDAKAEFLREAKILKGNGEGDLKLDENLKRRDAVVVLSRLFGVEEEAEVYPSEDSPFTDLTDPHYAGYVEWARVEGYAKGKTETTFDPNGPLTSQHLATFLMRALEYDVDYNKAIETAKDLGLFADLTVTSNVTRGDMAVMVYNTLNTKVNGSEQTLAEKLKITMPVAEADELKIKEVYTENLAEIVVELSNAKLVKDRDALTNVNNYRLSDSEIKVANVDVEGNNVTLTLVPYGRVDQQGNVKALVKGKQYTLTTRNIKELSGGNKFVAKDITVPTVEKVEFIGTHGIKVTTSEPVSSPQERNFRIDDKRTSMIIEQYGRELILTPYHKASFDKDASKLVIDELNDFANYRSATSFEDMTLSTDEALPVVEKAYRKGNTLTLVFDRDVYRDSIEKYTNRRAQGNVSFVERNVVFYAEEAEKKDTNVVEYVFEREIPTNAVVTVQGVQNHFGKDMVKQDVETILDSDDYAPIVISKLSNNVTSTDNQVRGKLTSSTKGMKIDFDKDIKEFKDALEKVGGLEGTDLVTELNKLGLENFFTVYRLEVSRKGKEDAKNVKVKVEALKSDSITLSFVNGFVNDKYRDFDYILEVNDFTDMNRNRMSVEYIDFQIVPVGTDFDVDGDIVVKNGKDTGTVEVVIKFNKAVDKRKAENPDNYFFGKTGKELLVDEAIVENDGETVSLVIRDTTVAKIIAKEVLEISPAVVSINDEVIDGSRFFNLRTGKRIAVDPDANANDILDILVAQSNTLGEDIVVGENATYMLEILTSATTNAAIVFTPSAGAPFTPVNNVNSGDSAQVVASKIAATITEAELDANNPAKVIFTSAVAGKDESFSVVMSGTSVTAVGTKGKAGVDANAGSTAVYAFTITSPVAKKAGTIIVKYEVGNTSLSTEVAVAAGETAATTATKIANVIYPNNETLQAVASGDTVTLTARGHKKYETFKITINEK